MEPQNDLGKLIREKVDSAQETLEAPVWDRIKTTLAKENRRRVFYNWSLNGLIVLFSVIGLYTITTTMNPSKEFTNTLDNFDTLSNPVQDSTANNSLVSKNSQSLSKVSSQATDLQKTSRPSTNTNSITEKSAVNALKPDVLEKTTTQQTSSSTEIQPEIIVERTEKVYYYYNSKDGQEVMTRDKKVIDSVRAANTVRNDSI